MPVPPVSPPPYSRVSFLIPMNKGAPQFSIFHFPFSIFNSLCPLSLLSLLSLLSTYPPPPLVHGYLFKYP